MALRREVVNLVGLHLRDDAYQRGGVGQIAPVKRKEAFPVHVADPFVKIEVLDAPGVERGAAADYAVDLISFGEKEFGEKRAVLARYAGYKSCFHDLLLWNVYVSQLIL